MRHDIFSLSFKEPMTPQKGLLVLQTTGYRGKHENLELNCDHGYDLIHLTAFEPGSRCSITGGFQAS